MSSLKSHNTERCITLLREFIEAAPSITGKKECAVLALSHLQKIYAGGDNPPVEPIPGCTGRPIMNIS